MAHNEFDMDVDLQQSRHSRVMPFVVVSLEPWLTVREVRKQRYGDFRLRCKVGAKATGASLGEPIDSSKIYALWKDVN